MPCFLKGLRDRYEAHHRVSITGSALVAAILTTLLIVPALVLGCFALIFTGIRSGKDVRPFLAANGLFVLGFAGIGISFYPYIVPTSLTIWEAAAPDESLAFLLVGALILVPMILCYTAYAYWVFRGKLNPDEGYH